MSTGQPGPGEILHSSLTSAALPCYGASVCERWHEAQGLALERAYVL